MLLTSVTYLAARILPGIFSLATIALLTRLLPVVEYGHYALALSVVGVVNGVAFAWNSQAVFRFLGGCEGEAAARLVRAGTVGFASSFGLVALVAVGVVATGWLQPAALVFAGLLMLLGFAWIEFTGFILNVEHRSRAYLALLLSRAAANLMLAGVAALAWGTAEAVMYAIGLGWLLLGALPPFTSRLRKSYASGRERQSLLPLFRYGFPLSISIVLALLLSAGDRMLLGTLSGLPAVAGYAAGFDVAQFTIGALGGALSLTFYPPIIAATAQASNEVQGMLRRYFALLVSLLMPASTGLALVAPALGQIMFGSAVRTNATAVMPFICVSAGAAMLKAYYADFSFQLARWTWGSMFAGLIALIVNFTLDWLLIPSSGALGAALASASGSLTALGASLALGRVRGYRLPLPGRDLIRTIFATMTMAAALLPIRHLTGPAWLIVQIVTGASAYALAAWTFNVADVRHTLQLLRRRR